MKVTLPQHDLYSVVRLTIKTPAGESGMSLNDSHQTAEINLPDGVVEDGVEVLAQFLDGASRPVGDVIPLKRPAPKPEPELEPKEEKDEEAPAEAVASAGVEVADEETAEVAREEVKQPKRRGRQS